MDFFLQPWYDDRHHRSVQSDMILTFIQGHKLERKLELVSVVVKWHEIAHTFAMFDYVREMTATKPC